MHLYWLALGGFALFVTAVSWNVPRARLWIVLGALSFIVSSVWWDIGLPYGAWAGGLTDLAICLIITETARDRWELWFSYTFGLMMLVDALNLMGLVPSHFIFAVTLELLNWAALFIVFITALLQWIGQDVVFDGWASHLGLGRLYRALHSKRRAPAWWRIKG